MTTASLHAQLKAKMAPGVGPGPGPDTPTVLPLPEPIVLAVELPPDLEEPLAPGPRVSVLSHNFCNAARGWLLVFRPCESTLLPPLPPPPPDKLSNMEESAPRLLDALVSGVPRGVTDRSLLVGLLVLFLQGLRATCST